MMLLYSHFPVSVNFLSGISRYVTEKQSKVVSLKAQQLFV